MFSAPLAGMTSAETLLDGTASRIAGSANSSPNAQSPPTAGDTVELTDEMTSLLQALTAFAVNAKALDAEASMAESTFSIMA